MLPEESPRVMARSVQCCLNRRDCEERRCLCGRVKRRTAFPSMAG
jgi:hypothetical protein